MPVGSSANSSFGLEIKALATPTNGFDLAAGGVLGMENASLGVSSLPGEIEFGNACLVLAPVEFVFAALGVSLAAGLLSGVLPARRAARLEPVEALRTE